MSKFRIKKRDLLPLKTQGWYGEFGGSYVPETLVHPLNQLTESFATYVTNPDFIDEYVALLKNYVGRPTPLTNCGNIYRGNPKTVLLLKREDLTHTGSHKINNALGQGLLAKKMGKRYLLAETGAGQHGVATATVGALLGMPARVYMGTCDMKRQAVNVARMRALGATVHGVDAGTKTLKDALNEALRDWVARYTDTHYVIGSVNGPHPYPMMVRCFQQIIGWETKKQLAALKLSHPDAVIACVGGGSNAMGIFHEFIEDDRVRLFGIEAGGSKAGHAASIVKGRVGILHGQKTYVISDEAGRITNTHSISAGMDYPGVGPEHAYLAKCKRVHYQTVSDAQAVHAFHTLNKKEGIMPALESSHALSYAFALAKEKKKRIIVVNLSGRGEKDMHSVFGVAP